ncbi:hypothetical protein EG028_20165 [Chitinophaga barathri]|uniref:Uncharacterized protein n=1 Tax=Chitinophaga barathri TaxID=1647451 RepID=A0A3N4MIF6_9BACT|nr:hypothetical protein EG028_20165 [Chitinophaga barathri]
MLEYIMAMGEVKRSHSGFRPGCGFWARYFMRPGLKPAFGQLPVHALKRASLRCPIFVRHLPAGLPTGCSVRRSAALPPPGAARHGGWWRARFVGKRRFLLNHLGATIM